MTELIEVQFTLEKHDRKEADPENKCTARHLVDADWRVDETDIHELQQ